MDPLLISSLTEANQVDGVYVLDVPPPGYVRGQGTSVVAIVGDFEMGPTDTVVSIGSSAEFTEKLGGYGTAPSGSEDGWRGYSGYRAVAGKQWPSGLRIVRPGRTAMASASVAIDVLDPAGEVDGRELTITAAHPGNYGNAIRVTIEDATDSSLTNGFRLTVRLGTRSQVIDNLTPGMTAQQLAAAVKAAGLTLVTLALADSETAEVGQWPLTAALTSGSDGTPDATKWTGAIDKLLARREVNIIFSAEPDGTTVTAAAVNTYLKGKLAPSSGPIPFVTGVLFGPAADDIDAAATAVATLRSDRLIYAWPWRRQYFAEAVAEHTDGLLLVPSADAIACALANTDPIYDPSSDLASRFVNACTAGLEFDDLSRDDYVTANRNGICALELDPDLGFRVVSGINTKLTPGQEMIHRRRTTDYLLGSIAQSLKSYQGQPITPAWKRDVNGAVSGFLDTQRRIEPVPRVLEYQLDTASVNSPTTEAQGFYNIRILARIPASARFIVLMAQVGPTVTVTADEANL